MNDCRSKFLLWTLVLAGTLLTASGCSNTTMSHSWLDPAYRNKPIRKAMVIGLARDQAMRRMFEARMAAVLEKEGVSAVPSYTVMTDLVKPGDEAAARRVIGEAVAKCGADVVTITRLVSSESAPRLVPGETYVMPAAHYRGFYGYYHTCYEVVSTPGYIVQDKTYVVETNVYDVATEKLIWTGVSETVNPDGAAQGIDSVGEAVVYSLKKEGLISK